MRIKNVFTEGELMPNAVVKEYLTTTQHGAIEGKRWFAFQKMDKDSVAGIIAAISGLI